HQNSGGRRHRLQSAQVTEAWRSSEDGNFENRRDRKSGQGCIRMSSHTIERMEVEVDGNGDAVILIHGLGGSSNTFSPQMTVLGQHRAIRPDLPGSGRARLAAEKLSIEDVADRIIAVAYVLNIRPA